jgi:2-C-methyl-D-erythritol 4-phosphate cytidylyltransferase/2-C-methyl-D-erythritol 2,4-cyclodiphosphate synthase
MLCGVRVAHDRGFIAHSDGDVALHALTDALLGALADGDIGRHFPPSEARWKGASSDRFLAFAVDRLRARGGVIDLLDVTILCERPKIGPHAEDMRAKVAEIASVAVGKVSVKATTTERLGFTGRAEGIAAMATASIRLPDS